MLGPGTSEMSTAPVAGDSETRGTGDGVSFDARGRGRLEIGERHLGTAEPRQAEANPGKGIGPERSIGGDGFVEYVIVTEQRGIELVGEHARRVVSAKSGCSAARRAFARPGPSSCPCNPPTPAPAKLPWSSRSPSSYRSGSWRFGSWRFGVTGASGHCDRQRPERPVSDPDRDEAWPRAAATAREKNFGRILTLGHARMYSSVVVRRYGDGFGALTTDRPKS